MRELSPSFDVIIAAIAWGIIGLFTRKLLSLGFTVIQITFIRAFFTFIEIAIIILITNREALSVKIKDLPLFIAIGVISITLFNICYFYTIEHSILSLAAILLYTAPFFVIILSRIFLNQPIEKKVWIAMLIALFGCLLTTGLIGNKVQINLLAFLSGILSGLFYGLYSIFSTIAMRKYKIITLIFYAFLFASITLLPFSQPNIVFEKITQLPVLLNCLGISLVSTLFPYYFYTSGLKRMNAGKAAVLAYIEPLTATLIGLLLFKEKLTFQISLGIILIFCSTFILNSKKLDISE